jgi:hypothetical protein
MLVMNRRNLFVWSANIFPDQNSQRVTHGGSIVDAVVDPYHDLKRESDKTTYDEAHVSCLPHDGVCRSVSHHD